MTWFYIIFAITVTHYSPVGNGLYEKHTDALCVEATDRVSAYEKAHSMYAWDAVSNIRVGYTSRYTCPMIQSSPVLTHDSMCTQDIHSLGY